MDGDKVGYTKSVKQISYFEVINSGHYIGNNQPKAVVSVLKTLLSRSNKMLQYEWSCRNYKFDYIQSFGLTDNFLVVVLERVWDHCFGSWLPVCRAHLSMGIDELKCLHQPHVLIGVPPNRQIIDRGMSNNALRVNDIGSTIGNPNIPILTQAAIVPRDSFIQVRNQGDLHIAKSSILPRLQSILHMWEFGVNWHRQHLTAQLPELGCLVVESNNLSWTDEGKIEGVEK